MTEQKNKKIKSLYPSISKNLSIPVRKPTSNSWQFHSWCPWPSDASPMNQAMAVFYRTVTTPEVLSPTLMVPLGSLLARHYIYCPYLGIPQFSRLGLMVTRLLSTGTQYLWVSSTQPHWSLLSVSWIFRIVLFKTVSDYIHNRFYLYNYTVKNGSLL